MREGGEAGSPSWGTPSLLAPLCFQPRASSALCPAVGGPPVPATPCPPQQMWCLSVTVGCHVERGVSQGGVDLRLTRPVHCPLGRLLPLASGKPVLGMCFDFFTSFVAYFNIFDLLRRRAGGTKNVLELFAGAAAPGRPRGPADRREPKFLPGVGGRWSEAGSPLLCAEVGEAGEAPAPVALAASACLLYLAEVVLWFLGSAGEGCGVLALSPIPGVVPGTLACWCCDSV